MRTILSRDSFGEGQLLLQRGDEALREQHHSATAAFGSEDAQTAFFEVDVFDSEIQGFSDSQSTSVEKMDNESGGIAVNIVNVGQEFKDLLPGGGLEDN